MSQTARVQLTEPLPAPWLDKTQTTEVRAFAMNGTTYARYVVAV